MAPGVCPVAGIPGVFKLIEGPLAFLKSEESYEEYCNVCYYRCSGGFGAQRWPGVCLWMRGF